MMQELNYIRCGDYYIPDIRLPEENRPIGRWGRMHRDYIKEHNPIRFNDLCLSGELWTYLADLNEQAQNRLELIIEQMKDSKEHKKLQELICRNEEKLKATMTDDRKELFEKYTDCLREHQIITDCLIFQNSFKLGAKMMLEVMEDN